MRSLLLAATLALAVAPSGAVAQGWTHFTDRDDMTGELRSYATSPRVSATRSMPFPYGDVRAWLAFGCDRDSEWAYVGFTQAPNIPNTTPREGGYSTFSARVRWDDRVERTRFRQDWGERYVHFRPYNEAIANLAAARTALLEIQWYGAGDVYFRFTLAGSSAAIQRAREACQAT